ncbi:ATP-binding cassette domain-containing protein [Actinoalloteichus caeruleus]|uniref:ABC-2 type transport system ATP-binding protein n=1 Tax=Actinoalloteichus caeruleus DSM 43889 TaxID=1120930 RepID=A0ABT1JIW4_ACTCY|nr:ABC transporter ATP-binding protein [Actinoalloteichus caeruleus]MCP2332445.1 ABC-2 type transport system ATP-binding protein [Actinoalloteichus caeruleus DSM 43889]
MTYSIEARDLRLDYRGSPALRGIDFRLAGGGIYGLIGRNGSGKTSLLSLVASLAKPTAGTLLVDGEDPFENPRIMPDVCLVQDRIKDSGDEIWKVGSFLRTAAALRPRWDQEYADRLVDLFELPRRKRISSLSLGKRSALNIIVGLASRAPVTIFDEAYVGLDAPSRYAFYDEVLADYMAHPRTVIMSSHLVEEVDSLFEEVLILDEGRLLVHEDTDDLRSRGVSLTGPAQAVDDLRHGLTVLNEQVLGGTKSITVYGDLDEDALSRARAAGVEAGPVRLQDLFVHLTRKDRR